jgi:hypothetical protein
VAVLAASLPWLGGSLDGVLVPKSVNDGQVRAVDWLSSAARRSSLSVWLPTGNYQQYPWSHDLNIVDPVSLWTSGRTVNPYVDSTYASGTQNGAALVGLQQLLADQLPGGLPPMLRAPHLLANALRVAGVRYVVVRTDALVPTDVGQVVATSLATAPGLHLVERFGSTEIWEVPKAPGAPRAVEAQVATLVQSSWKPLLENQVLFGGGTEPEIVDSPAAWAYAARHTTWPAVLDSFWSGVFDQSPRVIEPTPKGPSLDWGSSTGFLLSPGTALRFHADGMAAVHILGSNAGLRAYCNGRPRTLVDNPQPSVFPRWVSIKCLGTADFLSAGNLWNFGAVSTSLASYYHWVFVATRVLTRPGGGFVIGQRSFARVPLGSGADVISTYYGDPLMLGAGNYSVTLDSQSGCSVPGTAMLQFEPSGRMLLSVLRDPVCRRGQQTWSFRVPVAGAYQLLLSGYPLTFLFAVSVIRSGAPSLALHATDVSVHQSLRVSEPVSVMPYALVPAVLHPGTQAIRWVSANVLDSAALVSPQPRHAYMSMAWLGAVQVIATWLSIFALTVFVIAILRDRRFARAFMRWLTRSFY